MATRKCTPYLLGSGGAAGAIDRCLAQLRSFSPEGEIASTIKLPRHVDWAELKPDPRTALLLIANPHALHASTLLAGEKAGFRYLLTEKPVCVSLSESAGLTDLTAAVGVFHGYRRMWGPRQLKRYLSEGQIGRLISLEARYWQSSAARQALSGKPKSGWKDDPALSGPHDTLLDLGTHVVDLFGFLAGAKALSGNAWLSHANAAAPHRDTHAHIALTFPDEVRALASVSKTLHGMGNHLELTVLGTLGSLTWDFSQPDQLVWGLGADRKIVARLPDEKAGASLPPYHGMGWLEGYYAILSDMLQHMAGEPPRYPTLNESRQSVETLLSLQRETERSR